MPVIFPLQGSRTSDIQSDTAPHSELNPCPATPNCVLVSRDFNLRPGKLFKTVTATIKEMNPYKFRLDSKSSKVDAVFKIPPFGFVDDVTIIVEKSPSGSELHIRSSSRVGHSDLGVNRRRVKRILRRLNSFLPDCRQ